MPLDLLTLVPLVLIIILAVILILVAIVMFRTARFPIITIDVEPITPVEIDADAVAERLARAIQFQTISSTDSGAFDRSAFLGLHRLLEGMFPRVHSSLKREYINEYSLLYSWVGSNPELEPILLASHLDVVPADANSMKEWRYPPFSGQVEDGYIWGRGSMEAKSSVIAIMEAVEHLLKEGYQPERTVYLAFGHDEEIGGRDGAAQIAETLKKRGVTLSCVLDGGGGIVEGAVPGVSAPVATIGVAEKGYLSLVLEAEGESGQSSTPSAHNAIGMLSQAIVRLESRPFKPDLEFITTFLRYLGPDLSFGMQLAVANQWLFRGSALNRLEKSPAMSAFMRTTQAVTMIAGGVKDNIQPRLAKAVVNFRVYPGDTLRSVYEHTVESIGNLPVKIRTFSGETLEGQYGWESIQVSDPDSPEFASLAILIRKIFPDAAVAPYLVAGATDSRYYADICPTIFRFAPLQVSIEDLTRPHGINEHLSVENCGRMVSFFIEYLKDMAGEVAQEVIEPAGEVVEEA